MVDETIGARDQKPRWFWSRPSRGLKPALRFTRQSETKPDSAANARSTAAAMLIAFALFFVFESEGVRHFARDLPGNTATDIMVRAADRWHALMKRLGPARVQPAVRDVFERIRAIRW